MKIPGSFIPRLTNRRRNYVMSKFRYVSFAAFISISLAILLSPVMTLGQSEKSPSANDLKQLSVEELMNIEVTLVSRSPEKLTEVPSAIQVITGEDIRHSGATNIPEALRLVSNLQVAQLHANAWIISSRGFNTIFANKLLVMIDGRTVYTPLFGGVVWELQNVLLEDVDRIEVVSGPGGTLWGANAVNGVINIITKSSKETQGLYASGLAGTFVNNMEALRYGGRVGQKIHYRVYGQHYDRNPTTKADGTEYTDAWGMTQGGFKMDFTPSEKNAYVLQGDYYGGTKKTLGGNSDFDGQNVLGRWMHTISDRSDLMLQMYFDRYYRDDVPGQASDEMKTFDMDFQYRFPIAKRHSILVGTGYRVVHDNTISRTAGVAILPQKKELDLINGFIQDEISLARQVKFTIGTKVLHNVYTGIEVQPSARIAFSIREKNTLWAAVSRAVRTPSRYDVDFYLPSTLQPPNVASVAGGPNFVSEKVVAYELGYRIQPNAKSSFSISTFYNVYSDVYSVENLPGTLTYQIQNGSEGKSWGAEFAGTYQVLKGWRLRAGYTYINKKLEAKPGHNFDPVYLGNDARNQVMIHSMVELPFKIHFDVAARYLDSLPKTIATTAVPRYFTFDTRIAYSYKWIELSVVGQNLFTEKHQEFQSLNIPRSVYAKLSVRF
jgi:iron complex outermembrane receptor protein